MAPYASYFVQLVVTLLAVCGLAIVILFGMRRAGSGRGRGPMKLVGHLVLDARRAIYLVRVGEQVLVVGVGDGGFTKLGEMAASELPGEAEVTPAPFGDVLARVMTRSTSRGER